MAWSIRTHHLSDLFDDAGRPTSLLLGLALPQDVQRLAGLANEAATKRGWSPFLSNIARPTGLRGLSAWHISDPQLPPATLTLVTLPWDLSSLEGEDRFQVFDEASDELRDHPELRAEVGFAMAKHARDRKDTDLSDVLDHARSLGAYGTRVAKEP